MTEYLELGKRKLEIQWHNRHLTGHRPVLVFLHEGLGCTEMWKDFPEQLCRETGCPGFVFSRFGYGGSDEEPLPWKINFMHTQALKVMPQIIRAAGIDRYIIIGHSDGGSIGLIFSAAHHLKETRGLLGLITEAAHVFCEKITVDSIRQAKQNYDSHDLRKALTKYHGKNVDNAFRGWNDVWLNPRFMYWNIEKYLKKIKVPVMAVQGRQDQYGSLKQIDSIGCKIKNARTEIIEDCRHSPHLEQPDRVIQIMTGFIEDLL